MATERIPVRTLLIDNEPWFVLMDVCTAAGINNARMAKKRLDQADVSTTDVSDGTQNRKTSIINEAGLYDVILDSRKPPPVRLRRRCYRLSPSVAV